MDEAWKIIPGFDGRYEISSLGRVRRLAHETAHNKDGGVRRLGPKMLKASMNNGYLVVYLGGNGQTGLNARKLYIEAAVEQLFGIKPAIPKSEDGEEWRDIPGYEGLYQVSAFGRVRSVGRYVKSACSIHVNLGEKRRLHRPRILAGNLCGPGYKKVELSTGDTIKTLMVHRLVAITFIPNPLNLPVVHHIDENKLNNRVENLEWKSEAGNIQDWFDRRRLVVGTDTIEKIVAAAAAGLNPAEILAALPRKRKARKSSSGSDSDH